MKNLTKEAFVITAIEKLRTDKSKGIHVVYSGFNAAFKLHFKEEARQTIDEMVATGKLDSRPVTGGAMIYKKGEMSHGDPEAQAKKTLNKILN